MSPVSRIVRKTLKDPDLLENVSFLVEIDGVLKKKQIR